MMVVLAIALAFVLTNTEWFFTPLVISLLFIIVAANLIYYVNKTNKDLGSFLLAIKQGGFTSGFTSGSRGTTYDQLSNAFNEVIEEFRKISIQKESQFHYLQTVNENIGVALISFTSNGEIEMMNPAAKNLLNKPYLRNLNDLKKVDRDLYRVIDNLESGNKELLKIVLDGELVHLSIQAKQFILQEKEFKLVLLQNINNEIEAKEVEAWQKLISVLTHEIMNSVTPIISLITAVNSILQNDEGIKKKIDTLQPEEIEDIYGSLKTIENRSKGLLKFVNAYKDYSKTPEMNPIDFDIIQLIRRIASLLNPDMEEKNIKLSLITSEQKIKTKADAELIEQVLINLIKNAIEVLEGCSNPEIKIFIRKTEDNRVDISVSDNGPGIDHEIIEKIFVPFYTTKKKGTGIGLSLSRQIMKLHNGNISVKSEPGKGTEFSLKF